VPRIRRWHPISHEFNRDPEVRELRKKFGDWMGFVWQEMLAIADKNDGFIKGDVGSIVESLSHVSLSPRRLNAAHTILCAMPYMVDKGWIEVQKSHIFVCKYREYHITREKKESREGIKDTPPFLPTNPSLHPKRIIRDQAIQVLNFLNEKTGRSYEAADKTGPTANLKMIMARLDSGATPDHCRGVIARMVRKWKDDPKMVEFLRPKTLFNKTNFEQYLGERDAADLS